MGEQKRRAVLKMLRGIITERYEWSNGFHGKTTTYKLPHKLEDIRDQVIKESEEYLDGIREDLKSLEDMNLGIEVAKIGELLDTLSDFIQSLPEKVPETESLSQYINDILLLLEVPNRRTIPTVVDFETTLVILGVKIHLAGVVEEVRLYHAELRRKVREKRELAKNPAPKKKGRKARKKRKPPKRKDKDRIWKPIQAICPRFMGFDLRYQRDKVRRLYETVYGCYIFFEVDSKPPNDQNLGSALKAFLPHLELFVAWEMEKNEISEYYHILIYRNKMIDVGFSWRDPGDSFSLNNKNRDVLFMDKLFEPGVFYFFYQLMAGYDYIP